MGLSYPSLLEEMVKHIMPAAEEEPGAPDRAAVRRACVVHLGASLLQETSERSHPRPRSDHDQVRGQRLRMPEALVRAAKHGYLLETGSVKH